MRQDKRVQNADAMPLTGNHGAGKKKGRMENHPAEQTLQNTKGEGGLLQRDSAREFDYLAVFFAAEFTLLVNSVVAALTCFLMLSVASSKLPLASWLSASLVLTVMPNTSWLFA